MTLVMALALLPFNDVPDKAGHTAYPGKPAEPADQGLTDSASAAVSTKNSKSFIYEEKVGAEFDLRVWEADMAVLQTMSLMGCNQDQLQHKNIETRFFYGTPYHFQEITIYIRKDPQKFADSLRQTLKRFISNAALSGTGRQDKWIISINGQKTHLITLRRILEKPLPGTGRLAIVMDDMGGSLKFARSLGRLDYPVVFSILPYLEKTRQVADFAREQGIEIMLHLPMEPNTYSQGVDPGPGTLLTSMNIRDIQSIVRRNITQVPGAVGANNHMGSRFTQDEQRMEAVLQVLKANDLFFLDSLTTAKSVAEKTAEKVNLNFLKRHVFLDNVLDPEAILFQLRKAENIAVKLGMAVAIGHPHPETLQALQKWEQLRNKKVQVVGTSDFVSTLDYQTASKNITKNNN